MINCTIQQSKWLRGGTTATYLMDHQKKLCGLGHLLEQQGITDGELRYVKYPREIKAPPLPPDVYRALVSIIKFDPLHEELTEAFEFLPDGLYSFHLSKKKLKDIFTVEDALIFVNDSMPDLHDVERIKVMNLIGGKASPRILFKYDPK